MNKLEKLLGPWVIHHRWWIIAVTLLLVVMTAGGMGTLYFTTNYRIFFSKDNPQLLAFDALENTYAKNDNVLFVLVPDDGNVFTNRTLSAVEELTRRAWQVPYSSRVDSITNFQHTEADGDELIVRDLVGDAGKLTQQELENIRKIATAEPLLVDRLVSPDGDVTGVNVTLQMPGINQARETPEVVEHAREIASEIMQAYPGIDVRLTGIIMMNNAFAESSRNDIKSLVPVSFGLMILLLGLLVGSITGTACTLLVIAFSIIVAMGMGGYIGYPISPPSAIAPTIILTVAIANCVHILTSFLQNMRTGKQKDEAMVESLRLNLQPVFLASATTAIGFLMMNFSEVPPFRHLGNFVAMGVVASFVMSITLLPALVTLLPVKVKPTGYRRDRAMQKLGEFVVQNRRILLWGMAIIIIVLVTGLPRNQLNDIFVHYFDKSIKFRRDSDFTTENLTGIYNIEYSLQSGETGGISDPAFLEEVAAFSNWYERQPEVIHVNAITDVMKRLNRNLHNDDDSMYRLPADRELAAQYLLLYEMSLPYGLDLNNQINVDKSSTRMTVTLTTLSTNQLLDIEKRASDWLAENAPHIQSGVGSGTSIMFAHIGHRNIISMLIGTTVALFLISLLLVFALRSVKIGLVSLIPNLIPAALGFGLWGYFVGEIGLSLSVVTTMTLGIVIDDTVHFLSKYLRARREKYLSPFDAVRYAFETVGRALLITSVVLIAGFLVLALSSFELNSGMGLLTAIVIALALVADFLFLPPLLMKIEEKKDAKMFAVTSGPGSVRN